MSKFNVEFKSVLDVVQFVELIEHCNSELYEYLAEIPVIGNESFTVLHPGRITYDKDSISNGLYDSRDLTYPKVSVESNLTKTQMLHALVHPQPINENEANVPVKIAGYIQFLVTPEQKTHVEEKLKSINAMRAFLKSSLPKLEPSRSKRAKLTSSIFKNKGVLYQTFYRQLNIVPDGCSHISFQWNNAQLAPVKQHKLDWEKKIDSLNGIDSNTKNRWKSLISQANNVHQLGFVRPHITATCRYRLDNDDKSQRKIYKVHSPFLVLSTKRESINMVVKSVLRTPDKATRSQINFQRYRPILPGGKFSLVSIETEKQK